MRTIGILGGLGPEATVDYYKEIIKGFNGLNKKGELSYPEILIYSVNMSTFIGYLNHKDFKNAAGYLANCINKLFLAGADFAVMSANTPHLLYNEIKLLVNGPLISIVETCAEKARNLNLKRCALIGTNFTMKNDFYATVFNKLGIEIIVPDNNQMEFINTKLFTEMELGLFRDETKTAILSILDHINNREGIDSVILGCTEFPIMFTEDSYNGLPFLNTTKIHVDSIIKHCLYDD